MGSILTFECGCLLAIDAYPEFLTSNQPGLTVRPQMRYSVSTASWCAKHKDEVKKGLMQFLTKETEEITKFIDDWYHDRKPKQDINIQTAQVDEA